MFEKKVKVRNQSGSAMIALPKDITQEMDIKPGDEVIVGIQDGKIVVTVKNNK